MAVAMNRPPPMTRAPPITERTMLPRKIGTMIATMKGMVARSTRGSTWLPTGASAMASTMVIGTSSRAVARTAGWPTARAASRPM